MDSTAVEVVKTIPSILWVLLVGAIIVLFYRPIRDELLPRLTGFKAMGVEFSFVKDSIDAAIELAAKSPEWKVEVPSRDKERALNRAKQHLNAFRDALVLWVDDHPENNRNERKMFRQLGVRMEVARSTEEALNYLMIDDYDLVISDMARGDEATAGLQFLERFRKENTTTPVVFYIGVIDREKGVPAQAFGITNRPDELLQLTVDALDRKGH